MLERTVLLILFMEKTVKFQAVARQSTDATTAGAKTISVPAAPATFDLTSLVTSRRLVCSTSSFACTLAKERKIWPTQAQRLLNNRRHSYTQRHQHSARRSESLAIPTHGH